MKKSELIFNIISIPVDALMLILAGLTSFYLRQNSTDIVGPIAFQLELGNFLGVVYKLVPVVLLIFAALGLYNLSGTRKFISELGKVAIGVSLGLLIIVLLYFFDQTIFPSRFIILATGVLGLLFVVFGRLISKFIQVLLFKSNIGLHKLVLINGASEGKNLENFYKEKKHGYEVTKKLNFTPEIFIELEKLYKIMQVDEILLANPKLSTEQNLKLVEFCRNKGLVFSFLPNIFEVQRNVIEVASVKGFPIISLKNTPLDGWGKVVKRVLDIIASSLCLILTLPLFIILPFFIVLNSKGKVIYSAMREGRGKNFQFYKFRTMYSHLSVGQDYGGDEAEKVRKELWKKNNRGGEEGPFLKIKDDPRVTGVGRFLRKTKLDEIPQFWNVLKGDMSMVGPRAHVLDETDRYKNRYQRMFSIKPGIFGLSQIAQHSWPDLPFEEEIRLNTYYIENWSVWLDMRILAKSFWSLFFLKNTEGNY
ncbi:MAG: hypothetical protein COT92_02265 [Candidatus Doudnabacteria bacterium CG10_big_fil_rev_8_21_14_0_10_42_18]|uniref:Bacterial sugar transferase domain-containing protein n=1 Tax=Candidatus Doudnabacteria bacterium CG10_big_fil_rev_8_21_14_0_10_42_18 TaxID=1974552 RepID=A0A2H0VD44_9BACT|nr:MAG: hypothetical protein COT92_02265 [Candidatus Doudnabacteria bacterium CG10_big_fil_rev_8_21_14_0_10_42_18]